MQYFDPLLKKNYRKKNCFSAQCNRRLLEADIFITQIGGFGVRELLIRLAFDFKPKP